jgi:NAD(P)-dependent dehydrogenase (short-subunit alcohol dehydrogenase family)
VHALLNPGARPALRIEGAIAVVNGAASAVGTEVCKALARHGVTLIMVGPDEASVNAARNEVRRCPRSSTAAAPASTLPPDLPRGAQVAALKLAPRSFVLTHSPADARSVFPRPLRRSPPAAPPPAIPFSRTHAALRAPTRAARAAQAQALAERARAAVGLPDIVIHCQSGRGPVSTGDEECPAVAQDLALSAAQLARAFLPPFVDRQAGVILTLSHAEGGSPRQRAAAAAVEGLAQVSLVSRPPPVASFSLCDL